MKHSEKWLLAMKSVEHRKKQKENALRLGLKPPPQWGNKVNLGRKQTKEHKDKISKALKGKTPYEMIEEIKRKISKSKKGKPSWNKDKTGIYSEETKKKISINNARFWKGKKRPNLFSEEAKKKISEAMKGNKHNWQGGITPENAKVRNSIEFSLWREAVFARDNWICQKCKVRGGKLTPHHIRNFAEIIELRTSIENGITFCHKCHREFHKKYGVRNNNLEQLREF